MISKRDVQLGKIALRLGMVTKEQINGCLALKKKLAETKGKKVALGALLLKKGHVTEEQLEEIVRVHNEEKGGDASEEGEARKSRRSKRVKAEGKSGRTASAPSEGELEPEDGKRSRRAKRKEEGEEAAEKDSPRARDKGDKGEREKGEKSARAEKVEKADKKESGKRASKEAPASAGSQSEVDSAVFQSAPEDATDEEDRRIVACPECAKKYRIRKKQAGKRFACRRCQGKVKVPKDLFERKLEPRPSSTGPVGSRGKGGRGRASGTGRDQPSGAGKTGSASGVAVEEFTLGSSDGTVEADEEPTGVAAAAAAAATAATAVQKVQSQASIRDLAKAATKAQAKPLASKTRFGVRQAVTLGACLLALGGIGGGVVLWRGHQEAVAQAAREKLLAEQLAGWAGRLEKAKAGIEAAIKDPALAAAGLKTLLDDLETGEKEVIALSAENQPKARAKLDELDLPGLRRRALLAQSDGLMARGGPHVEEALKALVAAADLDPKHEQTQLDVARRQIQARRPKEAQARLAKLTSPAAQALLGLACERGDDPGRAAEAYAKLDDPLGPVLAARAWLLERNHARALETLEKVEGLKGQDLAAAKVIEAWAREQKRDIAGAERAFDEAASAAEDTPFPRVAKGEFLLRQGRAEEALKTIRAGNGVASSARGYLALGDALAATLELGTARTTWRETPAQALLPAGARTVAGVIDPFAPPIPDDPRATSHCRLATLAAAAGDVAGAQSSYGDALALDPFHPEAHAGLGHLDLLQEAISPFTEARIAQALRLCARSSGVEGELVRYPGSARVLVVRGAQLVQAGKAQEALDVLSQALQADAAVAPQVETLRIRAFVQMGQETKAIEASQRAGKLEAEGTAAGASVFAAAAAAFSGGNDAAMLAKVEQGVVLALAQNPYHGQALVLRARVRLAAGKPKEALADLDRAERVNQFLREAFIARGFLYVRDLPATEITRDTTTKAARDFETARNLEEKLKLGVRPETQHGLALVQFQLSNYREALVALGECLKADAAYIDGYRLRATILRRLNQPGADADEQKVRELTAKTGQGK